MPTRDLFQVTLPLIRLRLSGLSVSPRVLVVEGKYDFRQQLLKMLHKLGIYADGACGARIAMDLVQTRIYHLIITDIEMPGVNGMEFAAQVRHATWASNNALIAAYTTLPETLLLDRANAAGIDRFLSKPAQLPDVVALVNAMIDRWHAQPR